MIFDCPDCGMLSGDLCQPLRLTEEPAMVTTCPGRFPVNYNASQMAYTARTEELKRHYAPGRQDDQAA